MLTVHVFGAPAQFERDLICERTRAGLAAAASRGRRGARKPVVTADKLARARTLIAKGLTVREAASGLKVGKTALYDALAQNPSFQRNPSLRSRFFQLAVQKITILELTSSSPKIARLAGDRTAPDFGRTFSFDPRTHLGTTHRHTFPHTGRSCFNPRAR